MPNGGIKMIDGKNEKPILFPSDINHFKYLIKQYHRNFNKGKIAEAKHDATAVLLYLESLLKWVKNDH